MMLESKICYSCNKNKLLSKHQKAVSGISEIKIYDKPVLLTDTSILFCVINGYDTVSKIREALDNAYYNKNGKVNKEKIVFGGRTEGNLRARLKILESLGLVIANLKQSGRVPTYTITNLGLAVQNMFMAGLDLFSMACSDCIVKKMQTVVKDLTNKPGQAQELSY